MTRDLAPPLAAPQQMPGPRPLPLFLELVRRASKDDPALGARALDGLRLYQLAERYPAGAVRPEVARSSGATLRGCGGEGSPILLVPSLINPPHILDLDPEASLAAALAPHGRVLMLDWGPADSRAELSVGGHVQHRLLPLIDTLGEPPVLVGYCLGGTMALAASSLTTVRGVVTLAAPWNFSAYSADARRTLADLWRDALPAAERLGVLPIEVLQAAFWSMDPQRTVAKFARLTELDPQSPEVRRFIALEDWANAGEPLPLPAARELIEGLFGEDFSGRGKWNIDGQQIGLPQAPTLHVTASNDRIVPAETVASGQQIACPSGHVGMIVGRDAPEKLHKPLREWLAALPARG